MKLEETQKDREAMSAGEKKYLLFLEQKKTLDTFLQKGAISRAQYHKSLGDLREKMGIPELEAQLGAKL